MINKIIILGGYGNFGKRIAEGLSKHKTIEIYLAGRNQSKAENACQMLKDKTGHQQINPFVVDIFSDDFEAKLIQLSPDIVIHTSGPFQGQDYRVPEACIKAGSHYIDLADDRRYVCDIAQLNEQAVKKNLIIVSGASSVPGLSSTVIEEFKSKFKKIESIDIAIAPGNKAERGEATLKAILSYTGKPFKSFIKGNWQSVYGWMSSRRVDFGGSVGKRWLANVDVPDLELFPGYFKVAETVRFQAGLELSFLHHAMVFMGWLAKHKIVKNWARYSRTIFKMSHWFEAFGTDIGGMQIIMDGIDKNDKPLKLKWNLTAENNIGPFIPTLATVILADKLIENKIADYGAKACLNLFSLKDFDQYAEPLAINHSLDMKVGK